jgi:hypothetical protein
MVTLPMVPALSPLGRARDAPMQLASADEEVAADEVDVLEVGEDRDALG